MKKKIFLLFTIMIVIGLFITPKVKAAVGEWIGDYCNSCGEYGSAGLCDQVKYTKVGLFRVTFYLNGSKIGTSVNVSSSEVYQQLAKDAKWHWGEGKNDIVSYANGTATLGTPQKGGIDTILISGLSTSNVQWMLSPKNNSSNVQKILDAAGIKNFEFKNGSIYYKPSQVAAGDECEYQIQMVVEAMQVINWLCVENGKDNHRWIGTPYELNNGLRALGYDSTSGGNGYMSGSIVDKYLLSSLRLDQKVTIGDITFTSVIDCLTQHVRGYDAKEGYGFNVYDLTGEFKCEPPEKNVCEYIPGEEFKIDCCDDVDYLTKYYSEHGGENFFAVCCDVPNYEKVYSSKFGDTIFNTYYDKYCKKPDDNKCPPSKLTGEPVCKTATCDGQSNISLFQDPVFNSNSSIRNLVDSDGKINLNLSELDLRSIALDNSDNSFIAVAQQGETYKTTINSYCDMYCQEQTIITLPDFYPAANAGRYFQWYIDDSADLSTSLIKQEVVRICAEDIKLDNFIKEYYSWMNEVQDYVNKHANQNVKCGSDVWGILNVNESVNGSDQASKYCDIKFGCCMSKINWPTPPSCGKDTTSEECNAAWISFEAALKSVQEEIEGCERNYSICLNGDYDNLSHSDSEKKFKDEFSKNPKTFTEKFKEFLGCYDVTLGDEIETDLNFSLQIGDLNEYISDMDFDLETEYSSSLESTSSVCVDYTGDCENRKFFSYSPNINDLNPDSDNKLSMTCSHNYWASTDKKYSLPFTISNNASNNKTYSARSACLEIVQMCYNSSNTTDPVCVTGGPDYNEERCKSLKLNTCKSKYNLSIENCNNYDDREFNVSQIYSSNGEISIHSVPNFVEGTNVSLSDFPLAVNGFDSSQVNGPTNGWSVVDTAGNYTDIDWFKTFRLLVQTKTDSYSLKDGVNACVRDDGTVCDLISADEAKKLGLTISDDAEFICDCPSEEKNSSYYNEEHVINNSFVQRTDTWGVCQFSGYTRISEGGNYSVKYSTGSGKYPLSIYYWNIGSNAHFDEMLENCENCSGGACVYEGELCKLVIGNALMNDSWSKENTNWWDLSASYYVCKAGSCEPPEPTCPSGDCVEPPVCPNGSCNTDGFPTDDCENGKCTTPSGLALIYRSVDLDNPFGDRQAGENWPAGSVDSVISNNRGVSGSALYSSDINPLYSFKLTPDVVKQIRAFNSAYGRDYASSSTIAYPNDMMNATDENGNNVYNKGISQVLNNELLAIFETAAANNNSSLDEWFSVPLLQSCDDWYKLEDSGHSYCEQIGDSFRIISGDQKCWDYVSKYNSGGGK